VAGGIYRLSLPRKLVNALVRPLIRLGLSGQMHLLLVPGRKTGRMYSTPVKLVERDGSRWLVAPYGERSWVKNARAAGWVELRRRRRTERVRVVEVAPAEAGPVLRDYLRSTPVTKKFFDVRTDSPLEAFVAEAPRHPVFRIDHAERA
jgi:deazaflavin-dependent oxidoreductase (nitroreductase family)